MTVGLAGIGSGAMYGRQALHVYTPDLVAQPVVRSVYRTLGIASRGRGVGAANLANSLRQKVATVPIWAPKSVFSLANPYSTMRPRWQS